MDPHDELWNQYSKARPWVRMINLLGVSQYRPLVLAAAPLLQDAPERLTKLMKLVAVVSLRANKVVGLNTGDIYKAWNKAAVAVTQAARVSFEDVRESVRAIYPDDETFKVAFSQLRLQARGRQRRLLRFLLAGLEADASGKAVDWETSDFTIEHVLPEAGGPAWEHVSERQRERFSSHIGNYVPLESVINRRVGNAAFEDKKLAYSGSAYALAESVAGEQWGAESIRARGAQYAKRAAHIWRLDD